MTQTSSNSPGREPTDAVLLTVLESALMRLLERGLGAAAEESIRRVTAAAPCTGSRSEAPAPPVRGGPRASTVIPFSRPRSTSCGND